MLITLIPTFGQLAHASRLSLIPWLHIYSAIRTKSQMEIAATVCEQCMRRKKSCNKSLPRCARCTRCIFLHRDIQYEADVNQAWNQMLIFGPQFNRTGRSTYWRPTCSSPYLWCQSRVRRLFLSPQAVLVSKSRKQKHRSGAPSSCTKLLVTKWVVPGRGAYDVFSDLPPLTTYTIPRAVLLTVKKLLVWRFGTWLTFRPSLVSYFSHYASLIYISRFVGRGDEIVSRS